jgi:hypothetical protein
MIQKNKQSISPYKALQRIRDVVHDDLHIHLGHKALTVSDLDDYERPIYNTIATVFNSVGITGLTQPLIDSMQNVAETYIDIKLREEQEELTALDVPLEDWKDIFLQATNEFINSYVPNLVNALAPEPLTNDRALGIAVTETTNLTAIINTIISAVYDDMNSE